MKITIICIGSIKEKYLQDALNEYVKRLSPSAQINITQIKECKLPDKPSNAEILKTLERESVSIKSLISKNAYTISLCIEGKQLTSEEFADIISSKTLEGKNEFVFIIGSSNGLSEQLKKSCDMLMSFSKMTFPHQLFRVMLAEQIYRAVSIINNTKYHK